MMAVIISLWVQFLNHSCHHCCLSASNPMASTHGPGSQSTGADARNIQTLDAWNETGHHCRRRNCQWPRRSLACCMFRLERDTENRKQIRKQAKIERLLFAFGSPSGGTVTASEDYLEEDEFFIMKREKISQKLFHKLDIRVAWHDD